MNTIATPALSVFISFPCTANRGNSALVPDWPGAVISLRVARSACALHRNCHEIGRFRVCGDRAIMRVAAGHALTLMNGLHKNGDVLLLRKYALFESEMRESYIMYLLNVGSY